MSNRTGGVSTTKLLVIIAVVLAVVVVGYLVFFHQGDVDMRTYHCEACGKDFQVDINTLGNSMPKCPYCSSDKVTLVPKKK